MARTAGRRGPLRDTDAVIIGAGAAGLAVAQRLRWLGVGSVLIERGDVPGQSWHDRYEGLRLNTTRWLSDLPGYRMPRGHDRFPSRIAWADYLSHYASRHRLHIQTRTTAHRIDAVDGGWQLTTDHGRLDAQAVVVATGHDRVPTWPDAFDPGSSTTRVIHSADFRSPRDVTEDRVLVVGAGNSGCEIAAMLADGRRQVWLSVRTPPLVFPETFLGVSITAWGLPLGLLPDVAVDWFGKQLQAVRYGDLEGLGLGPSPQRLSSMRHRYFSPPIDRGIVDAVRRGHVDVVPAVRRVDGAGVELDDGTRVEPQLVIAATGYRPALEPLVGHLGVLTPGGEPRMTRDRSARGVQGLYFAGFTFGLLALLPYIEIDARRIARSIRSNVRG